MQWRHFDVTDMFNVWIFYFIWINYIALMQSTKFHDGTIIIDKVLTIKINSDEW